MASLMAKSTVDKSAERPTLPTHGAATLPSVEVDSYNLEIEDEHGFVGDKANRGAFRQMLEDVRKTFRAEGEDDPLGDKPSDEISKKKLDALLAKGDPEAGAVVQSAIENFAQQLASVIKRFLKTKTWRDTECIVVGGGFRDSRAGELAIGRAGIILKEAIDVDLQPIHHHPDEAALVGAAHLLPAWMIDGYDAILGVDVGGTNIRAGVVDLNLSKAKDLSKARVAEMKLWRHQEEEGVKRDDAVQELVAMLSALIAAADKSGLRLAPLVGIGCPGVIREDGSIERGAQNLPGNWESSKFNLPQAIRGSIPSIGEHETVVVMHNDAVVQGLSELPFLEDYRRWGVLTIGTGLGNARFTTRKKAKAKRQP
jgi:predicted NBD/HSP70 family sugar kinase